MLRLDQMDKARVAIIVVDAMDEDALNLLRQVQRQRLCRTVLVASKLEDGDLVSAVEVGVVGLVRRNEATPDRLVDVVTSAAAARAVYPPTCWVGCWIRSASSSVRSSRLVD